MLWMIGWDQVTRDERNKACLNAVHGRLDENCRNILQVTLTLILSTLILINTHTNTIAIR